ncbi:sugar ABC transporter permease, partial [Pseudomonas sp. CrR14]|nr:sugar ABC transporter permease [Pseudomonas sp. CrR14]
MDQTKNQAAPAGETPQAARPSLLGHLKSHVRDYGMLMTLVVIMAL